MQQYSRGERGLYRGEQGLEECRKGTDSQEGSRPREADSGAEREGTSQVASEDRGFVPVLAKSKRRQRKLSKMGALLTNGSLGFQAAEWVGGGRGGGGFGPAARLTGNAGRPQQSRPNEAAQGLYSGQEGARDSGVADSDQSERRKTAALLHHSPPGCFSDLEEAICCPIPQVTLSALSSENADHSPAEGSGPEAMRIGLFTALHSC